MKKNVHIYYHVAAVVVLSYFVIFLKLDSFHMRWWDESMFAVNTYEMIQNGKFFSAYFDNLPDIYNTKPPLTNWCQIVFIKLLGYNELAIRLPSAIAAGLTVIVLFVFITKKTSVVWAWASALILLTSSGFINFHTARTGDSDSLLTLFLLLSNLSMINYILREKEKDIFIFFIFISLAFATKAFAALLFIPAYFIILLHRKKLKQFIVNWSFLAGACFFLFLSVGLFLLRELDTPGFLNQTFFRDACRIFRVIEDHTESTLFYFDNLFKSRFSMWAVLFSGGVFLAFFSKSQIEKKMMLCIQVLVFVYFVIITLSITKLEWYDMPLFPYLAMLAGYPIFLLVQNVSVGNFRSLFLVAVMVIFFSYPYYIMFDKSQGNTINSGEQALEANELYIFKKSKENTSLDGVKVYYHGHKASLLFYKYKLIAKNQSLELVSNSTFKINDKVLVSNDSLKKVISNKYKFSILDCYGEAELIQISDITN